MATGAFKIEDDTKDPQDELGFNLKPKPSFPEPVPDDQRDLQREIYGVIGVLKQLRDHTPEKTIWDDFGQRLRQAAEVGLTGRNVKTRLLSLA